ncbi:SacI homology domain-containing protein [Zychaea mexicana]|uniref:Sac phosphatase domain-containing protein n=1 Tax=Zychaea mexicana TaxID=64656 RepID=UPI0022FDD87F|nr:Sac phosphatase domain-containing protein [Zychaea mexicana]KAI9474803.1 SacI homology domain-containing protein [Zychaea mexicana]
MQTHLLLRDHPRALALRPTVLHEAPSGVLMFEQYSNPATMGDRAITKLLPLGEFEDTQWRILNSRPVFGCLGMINVMGECFIAIVTDCVPVGRIRAGEEVYKIVSVSFYSLSSSKYDDLDMSSAAAARDYNTDSSGDEWSDQAAIQHPCAQLEKLFSVGNFYFTPDFDLTKTVQARTSDASSNVHAFDDHFLWNKFLISGLLDFRAKLERKKQMDLDRGGFLVFAIRGYVGVETVSLENEKYELSVISKLSCKRAGTRFNSRGIDDNGHVANFVETETVLYSDRVCYAFTQTRGSVPVFWEQQGIVNQKLQIARGPGATQPAVKRHFTELINRYQSVCNINLLSAREQNTGESLLGSTYTSAVHQLHMPESQLRMVNFDLHAECRGGNYDNLVYLLNDVRGYLDQHGFFLMDSVDNRIVNRQTGCFRTNCLDCLDRTNLVQNKISSMTLQNYLGGHHVTCWDMDMLMDRHSHLWAENGDGLSRIYAGTGALKSAFTRTGKVTFMNMLNDATRSANRFFINTFQDKAKQEVIDQLLGKLVGQQEIIVHDPISDSVSKLMVKRLKEYSTSHQVTIFCGTYNLNGKSFKGESLDPWLLQHSQWGDDEPDIYAVGFQEIVELSPQQVMTTDAEKRKIWEEQIERTLNSNPRGKSRYVMLRSNQLVGAALVIFVKANIVENIRNVETSIKKTGIMGIAGNKGAVAIRMDYGDTSICFLAAHFASGHSNYEDRNADFHTINTGLRFLRGRTIDSHDNIFWLSDLNYRVSLSNEEARGYAAQGNIDALLQADQLQKQMQQGLVFPGYQEGPITFLPTYKYDNGKDVYDTSEKQRVPGWTDRILYKGKHLELVQYARAELYTSDHRPVFALFEADIVMMDHDAKARLQKELYQKSLDNIPVVDNTAPPELPRRRTPTPPSRPIVTLPPRSIVDTLIDLGPVNASPSLPKPSTELSKWWETDEPLPRANKHVVKMSNPFRQPLCEFSYIAGSISDFLH